MDAVTCGYPTQLPDLMLTNLHKHLVSLKSSGNNHQSGYTSDFAEQSQTSHQDSADNHQFHKNQWVAFSAESSSMKRVDEWVRGLDVDTVIPVNEEEDKPSFMASSKMVRSPSGNGLHALNLSKNKISVIEGLRELTCLRVLDLSYNRISRIGQGKDCSHYTELYSCLFGSCLNFKLTHQVYQTVH
ncbi:hypothetical protein F2Q69_00051828 [Brassica cretica]|uniref:Uncharacterized protein n=1 Tax=Brassica cretica TaxID=69181 RepID=A0A8S9PWV1_BRACR|nr:hypothetical protein F2Q69_00051828 [Brassica cretica]